jgi:hypothetical protein
MRKAIPVVLGTESRLATKPKLTCCSVRGNEPLVNQKRSRLFWMMRTALDWPTLLYRNTVETFIGLIQSRQMRTRILTRLTETLASYWTPLVARALIQWMLVLLIGDLFVRVVLKIAPSVAALAIKIGTFRIPVPIWLIVLAAVVPWRIRRQKAEAVVEMIGPWVPLDGQLHLRPSLLEIDRRRSSQRH